MASEPCETTVIYSPGMMGDQFFDRAALRALGRCGPRTVMHSWTRYVISFRNLRNRAQHGRAADELAAMATAERGAGRRVVLVGHSTGCLVALEALERLGEPVDMTVLMEAAVHGGWDLRPALARTPRLINFHSMLDILVSLGTTLVGTADGRHRPAAGWRGFHGPGSDDPRLQQIAYRPRWARLLHLGGHLGPLNPRFVRGVLWPCIETGAAP